MSDAASKIHEKLMIIQSKLIAPKGQYNNFGKYKYRSCEDILEAAKPLLKEVKATLIISDDLEQIGDRYYIRATAALYDTESPYGFVENHAYAREEESKKGMDGSQITGTASSYARKYALNGLFAIDDTKDSDATNDHDKARYSKPQSAPVQSEKKVTEAQLKRLFAIAAEAGATEEQLKKACIKDYKKESLRDLTMKEYNLLVDRLEKTRGKA